MICKSVIWLKFNKYAFKWINWRIFVICWFREMFWFWTTESFHFKHHVRMWHARSSQLPLNYSNKNRNVYIAKKRTSQPHADVFLSFKFLFFTFDHFKIRVCVYCWIDIRAYRHDDVHWLLPQYKNILSIVIVCSLPRTEFFCLSKINTENLIYTLLQEEMCAYAEYFRYIGC